jgi:hypothetical protein
MLKEASVNAVRDLAKSAPIFLADPSGAVLEVLK